MAFDEKGQADSLERKASICKRAYQILTERVGFPPDDIIFDPNVFAIATGIEEHDEYARAYIGAAEQHQARAAACTRLRRRLKRVVPRFGATTACARRSTPCSCTTRSVPA